MTTETAATSIKTQDERDSEQLNAQLLRSLESPVEEECSKALAVGQAHVTMTTAQAELEKREDIAERWKAAQVRINRRHADLTAELAAARATQMEAVLRTAFDTPEVLNFKWSLKDLSPLLNEHAALAQVLNELPRRIRATDRDRRIAKLERVRLEWQFYERAAEFSAFIMASRAVGAAAWEGELQVTETGITARLRNKANDLSTKYYSEKAAFDEEEKGTQ